MAFYKVCGNYYGTDNDANSLMHYRTPGSKNGVRKYQYEDGTLTPAGKIHYGIGNGNTGSINLPKGSQTPLNRTAMVNYRGHAGMPYSIRRSPNYYVEEEATLPNRRLEADGAGSKRMHGPGRVAQKSYNNISIDIDPKGTELGPKGGAVGTWRAETKTPYQDSVSGVIDRHPESRARLSLRDPVSNAISSNLQRDVRRPSGVAGNIYDAKRWVDNAAGDVKNWGEQAGRDVGNAVNEAKRWVGDRASDAKNWGEQAVGNVKKAGDKVGDFLNANNVDRMADDAKNWVGERASDVKNWGEQAVGNVKKTGDKVGDWVGDRASDVKKAGDKAGDWVGAKAKDVSSWGSGAVNKGRDFITGLFGKKKKQSAPEPKKSNENDIKKIAGKNVSKPKK